MFGLRSAQSRAIVAVALGLLLLSSMVAVAAWRVQDTRERHDTLQHTSAASTALEHGRAQFFLEAAAASALMFIQDPALAEEYQLAAADLHQDLSQARAEMMASGKTDDLAALDGLGERIDAIEAEIEAAMPSLLAGDQEAILALARTRWPEVWPTIDATMNDLEALADAQESKLAAHVAAANRASDTTLWLTIGLSALAFLVVAAVAALVVSVVRPLAALRASAGAIAARDLEARARVSGPEEVASLAGAFNEMTDALSAKTRELAGSEERLKILFEFAPDAYFLHDLGGNFLDGNRAAEQLVGYEREELIGKNFLESGLLPPSEAPIAAANVAKWAQGLPSGPDEVTLNRKDGSQVVAEVRTFPVTIGGEGLVLGIARDVSERKRAEETLRESEERFRQVAETAREWIWEFDADGHYTYCGPAVSDILGYGPEEVTGKHFLRFVAPEDTERILGGAKEVAARKRPFRHVTVRKIHKDGHTVVVESTGLPILDAEGNLLGYRGADQDITKRKRAEEALRESEERFRQVAETAREWIWEVDPQGRYTYCSPAVRDILGYEPEEMIGKRYYRFYRREEKEQLLAEDRRTLAERTTLFRETGTRVHKDGRTVVVETTGLPIVDAAGTLLGYRGVNQDITERKRAEEALRESEERHRRLAAAAFEGLVIHEKGKFLDANPAFATMFGYELSEVIGMHALDFTAPESRDLLRQSIVSRRREPFEAAGLRKDGSTLLCELRGKDIPYRGRVVTVTAVRDVTERKRAEEALRESEERFRQVAETAREWIWEFDADGRYTYCSPAVKDILGYEADEVLGKHFLDLVAPEDRKRLAAEADNTLASKRTFFRVIARKVHKDGHTVVVESSGLPILDGEGNVLGCRGVNQDITKRKRAEEALRESEERYRRLVELSPETIAVHTEGKIVYINAAGARLLGAASPEELIGKPIFDFLHPHYREIVRERIRGVHEHHKQADLVEEKFVRLDGQVIDTEVTAIPVTYLGNPAVLAVVRDISERKRAEEALQKARDDVESKVERRMQQVNGYGLTFRELGVLHLVAAGKADKEIATVLGISPLTARKHMANILDKMGAASRTEAGVRALREGLLD